MQSPTLKPGTIIKSPNSEYRIEKVLGSGGFGITYLASGKFKIGNVPVEIKFAIKEHFMETCFRESDGITVSCTPTSQLNVEQSRKDFLNEAKRLQTICQLSDHIVNVNETFEANGTAYYVMEYLDGGSPKKMNESEAINLILQISEALSALHDNKLLHLDIKPDNIILKNETDGNQFPVLIDFGLAKHFDKNGNPTSTPNAKGLSNGYAPIEQGGVIDEFAPTLDIYALGATLLYLLTGKNPPSSTELVDAQQSKLKTLIPENVSSTTRNAILHAMTPNKNERTPDVATFVNELTDGNKEIKKSQVNSIPGSQTQVLRKSSHKFKFFSRGKNPKKKKWIIVSIILAPIFLLFAYVVISIIIFNYENKRESERIEQHNLIVDELNTAFYDKNYPRTIELANQLPDNMRAQYILGFLYENGLGVNKDTNEAIKWYEKAAENGLSDAMFNLGFIYHDGEGVDVNYPLAMEWWKKAAERGESAAMYNVGVMYELGDGVPADPVEALNWYRQSANRGFELAEEKVKDLEKNNPSENIAE